MVRQANSDDAPLLARMLHDFNTEFSDPSPGVEVLVALDRALARHQRQAHPSEVQLVEQ